MLFRKAVSLPLRLRLLLALIAAAGAGAFLTYSGLKSEAAAFIQEETGERLFLRLTLAGDAVEKEVHSGLETARLIAGRAEVRETLLRLSSGSGQPGGRETLAVRLAGYTATSPSIAALELVDAGGNVAASAGKIPGPRFLQAKSGLKRLPGGAYIGFPSSGAKALEYTVAVPVSSAAQAGNRENIGELRCLFKGIPLPAGPRGNAPVAFTLAERQGNRFKVTGTGGDRELSLNSDEAAPLISALAGKDGYAEMNGAGGKTLYAYLRLPAYDWLLTAATPYSAAARRGKTMLGAARLKAILAFAFLALTAFLAAGLVLTPVTETARAAGAFLEECGKAAPAAGEGPDIEVIDKAIAEAAALLKARGEDGADFETETEKLREEDADLKYQNAELEKLNKYLLDREIKISELKKEISELKEKFTREPAE